MSDNLDTLTDAALSEVFAVEVAGIPPLFVLMKRGLYYRPNAQGYTSRIEDAWKIPGAEADEHVYPHDEPVTKHRIPYASFATSAEAVLAHAPVGFRLYRVRTHWLARCPVGSTPQRLNGRAKEPSRAACLALIRAKRAEKGGAS